MLSAMTTHAGPPDDDRYAVVRLVQRLAAASLHFSDRAGAARGLHRSDLQALQVLAQARDAGDPGLTAGRLARALALSPSATTTLVDRLERAGHVRREHDETDRRRVALAMTETAGSEARAIYGPLAAAMHEAMQEFDDAEVDVVLRFLRVAATVVEDSTPDR